MRKKLYIFVKIALFGQFLDEQIKNLIFKGVKISKFFFITDNYTFRF